MRFLHLILFFLTFISTTAAGTLQLGLNPLSSIAIFLKGLPFSLTLIFILLSHELGHFFVSKYYHVAVTLPYFIPAPSLIGTFGALIKIKAPMPNRKVLFDIGIAGPLTGIIVCLPILIYGLSHSKIVISPTVSEGIVLGECLLLKVLTNLIWGNLPQNANLILHPTAFAGWLGLFVTALNLIPASQLDGGHIAYAVLNKGWHKLISRFIVIFLMILGIFAWLGWLVWAVLLLAIGLHHPEPIDVNPYLGGKRIALSVLTLSIFILTFIPVPFKVY
jgi:membrane-associated protease RseP (regulator of RpoE activity)